jgi:hypothetical protein
MIRREPEGRDELMDPASALTLIGTGLGIVDRFYDLAKKWKGEQTGEHSVKVDAAADKLVINDHGDVQEISANELEMSAFDKKRHDTLRQRIEINWNQYNDIDVARASAAADEKARLATQMNRLEGELCPDFRELVGMYETILRRGLPDHYTLYGICA